MSYYKELGKKLKEQHKVMQEKVQEELRNNAPEELDTFGEVAKSIGDLTKKVDEINVCLTDVAVPLILSDWTVLDEAEGTYQQVVTVEGITENTVPVVVLSSADIKATEEELYSYSCISDVITSDGAITFIATEKPTISFTVIAKGILTDTNTNAQVTALVARISNLEIEVDKLKTSLVGITVELPLSNWIFDEAYNTYSQTITIEGVSEDSVPIIALKSAGSQASEEELASYAYISDVITEDDSIKFIALEKPSVSLFVVAKSIWA